MLQTMGATATSDAQGEKAACNLCTKDTHGTTKMDNAVRSPASLRDLGGWHTRLGARAPAPGRVTFGC